VAEFYKLIANVRDALERHGAPAHNGAPDTVAAVPTTAAARRVELASGFARELHALGGHFLGTLTMKETVARVLEVASALDAHSVVIGAGLRNDLEPIADALERAGIGVIRTAAATADDAARAELRARLARCDFALVEADYAIAATGTLAMLATPERPGSLTLVPPANVILVDATRILPDLAAVIAAIGPAAVAAHRLALVTGPSRTADIEKRIVLGVHGPHSIHVAALWDGND
jgi:L-lactate dehydrogenase complex protein LldG